MISRRFGSFGVVWTPLSDNFFLYTNNFGLSGYFWAPPMGQNDSFLVCRLCHLAQGVCVGVLRKKKTSQSPMSCVILCRIWLGAQFQRKFQTFFLPKKLIFTIWFLDVSEHLELIGPPFQRTFFYTQKVSGPLEFDALRRPRPMVSNIFLKILSPHIAIKWAYEQPAHTREKKFLLNSPHLPCLKGYHSMTFILVTMNNALK